MAENTVGLKGDKPWWDPRLPAFYLRFLIDPGIACAGLMASVLALLTIISAIVRDDMALLLIAVLLAALALLAKFRAVFGADVTLVCLALLASVTAGIAAPLGSTMLAPVIAMGAIPVGWRFGLLGILVSILLYIVTFVVTELMVGESNFFFASSGLLLLGVTLMLNHLVGLAFIGNLMAMTEREVSAGRLRRQLIDDRFSSVGQLVTKLRAPFNNLKLLIGEGKVSQKTRQDAFSSAQDCLRLADDLHRTVGLVKAPPLIPAVIDLTAIAYEVERVMSPRFQRREIAFEFNASRLTATPYRTDIYRIRGILMTLTEAFAFALSAGSKSGLGLGIRRLNDDIHELEIIAYGSEFPISPADFQAALARDARPSELNPLLIQTGLFSILPWVQELDGKLEVTPSSGTGMTVTLRLPVSPVSIETQQIDVFDVSSTGIAGKRVLLVDDEPVHLAVSSAFLRVRFKAEPVTASSAQMALDLLSGSEASVALIITDYVMPDMNGLDFIRQVRARGLTMPIIALTASLLTEELAVLSDEGADHILEKPLDVHKLLAALSDSGLA